MLWVIEGNQGAGKTLFMIRLAYQDYLAGRKIYSNIHLSFPYTPIDYRDVIECKYSKATVLIDEVHLLLGARRSMSKVNDLITSSFCSQIRKQDLRLYLTTQRIQKIDTRLRSECDFRVQCDRWVFDNKLNKWEHKTYNDGLTPKSALTIIKAKVMDLSKNAFVYDYFIANEYYKMYNSYEIVKVTGLDEYLKKKKEKSKSDDIED